MIFQKELEWFEFSMTTSYPGLKTTTMNKQSALFTKIHWSGLPNRWSVHLTETLLISPTLKNVRKTKTIIKTNVVSTRGCTTIFKAISDILASLKNFIFIFFS